MAVQTTYPGVYVQEVPSGVRTIVGVATSITCFVGRTKSGPLLTPARVQNPTDFIRTFGDDATIGDLSRYVRLFFLNGGTDCYITRIAHGAQAATVTLRNEAKTGVLTLTAASVGAGGSMIRVGVNYNTPTPENTFNLELFQTGTDSRGQRVQLGREVWTNLTMDPASPSFAPTVLTQKSQLVTAIDALAGAGAQPGYSLSSVPIVFGGTVATLLTAFGAALGGSSAAKSLQVSVDGNPFIPVTFTDKFDDPVAFPEATVPLLLGHYQTAIAKTINDALLAFGITTSTVTVTVAASQATAASHQMVVIAIQSAGTGDVLVQPAPVNDAAVPLGFGTAHGGVEAGAHAARRPAPTGISFKSFDLSLVTPATAFVNLTQNSAASSIRSVTLDGFDSSGAALPIPVAFDMADNPVAPAPGPAYWEGGTSLGARLAVWRDAINAFRAANAATFPWTAELWGTRIAFIPTAAADNAVPGFSSGPTTNIASASIVNVRYESLGNGGGGTYQTPGLPGLDGTPPHATDYDDAYAAIDRDVDLFNLLVLPPEHNTGAVKIESVYATASVFCQSRRAFLIMDPPDTWGKTPDATGGVGTFRIGTVKDYSAVYFPRLTINEGGLNVTVGPAGAAAGIYARTDANRGVWKAPAGTEADFRGVNGVDRNLTNGESGQLNPLGINAIRVMPEGVLSWGARTNDGADMFASEYKYIPIRRLALNIEESLYRGLKWVVFEPNDSPLWASIRLNVGAFMHGLYRQGAFQGTTPKDAYFVKCDGETTTQADRDLGIVNIWVGFAPLKPAEFVILYLQQIAGALQT